jgi:hypothetical protein
LLVSHIWFEFGSISPHEEIIQLNVSSVIWLIILVIHFIVYRLTRKKSFKGLKKSDIFE